MGYGSSDNNGDLLSQNIQIGSTSLNQTYSYDSLDRVSTWSEAGGCSQSNGYDPYGNRWVTSAADCGNTPSLTPRNQSEYNAANNRLALWGYDPVGSITSDPLSRTFWYDAENQQTRFDTGNVMFNATYDYDGDGRRVRKLQDGVATVWVYDFRGLLVAEYSSQPASEAGTSYLTTDHLGSTRVITNAMGTVTNRMDDLPFGEEIAPAWANRNTISGYSSLSTVRQRFTGKERDQESGLDFFGARYMSSAQGRFMTPDPAI